MHTQQPNWITDVLKKTFLFSYLSKAKKKKQKFNQNKKLFKTKRSHLNQSFKNISYLNWESNKKKTKVQHI